MVEKVNLDAVAAQIVHDCARQENRTASNAASTLIRRAWLAREAHIDTKHDAAKVARS